MSALLRLVALLAMVPTSLTHAAEPDCFGAAAERHSLDQDLLIAIAKVESNFNPRAIHYNTDGTHDIGVMQINSRHLPKLLTRRISEDTLLNRPCRNIDVGAEILADFVQQFGPTWRAVGAYGAGSLPEKEGARRIYASKVATALLGVRSAGSLVAGQTPKRATAMQVVD